MPKIKNKGLKELMEKHDLGKYDLCSITKYSYPVINQYVNDILENEKTVDHIDYILAEHFNKTKAEFLEMKK